MSKSWFHYTRLAIPLQSVPFFRTKFETLMPLYYAWVIVMLGLFVLFLFLCSWCMQCFVSWVLAVSSSTVDYLEILVFEMTYYVSNGTLKSTHSLIQSVSHDVLAPMLICDGKLNVWIESVSFNALCVAWHEAYWSATNQSIVKLAYYSSTTPSESFHKPFHFAVFRVVERSSHDMSTVT